MTKTPKQKIKYLENEKSFQDEIKSIFFSLVRGFQLPKNCLRPDTAPLIPVEIVDKLKRKFDHPLLTFYT